MEEKKNDYIAFLVNQIRNFQKDKNELSENDLSAIKTLLSTTITNDNEINKAINIPLAFLIGNATIESNVGKKKVLNEINNSDNVKKKQRLKDLKKKVNIKKVIKSSHFLTNVVKKGNIIDEYLISNIPAIDCIISNNSYIARGYTPQGADIIYEIYGNDENATKKDIELISTKQIIETPENYFNKNAK